MAGASTMELVFAEGNEFWIEKFTVGRLSKPDAAITITDFNCFRQGQYMAGFVTLDHAATAAQASLIGSVLRNQDATALLRGQPLINFEVGIVNNSGGAVTIGFTVMMFMRGVGR